MTAERAGRVAAARVRASADGRDISRALGGLAATLGWGGAGRGPFGAMVPAGARVVVKPNWVMHRNEGPWGLGPLVSGAALVRAVVEGVLRAAPARVLVGDAPLQECDFARLLAGGGLQAWARRLAAAAPAFAGVRDFRRTACVMRDGLRRVDEDRLPASEFVLFDLGGESLLEPITRARPAFRVTQYDPRRLAAAHGPGRHRYLVAREVIEADVVVNLPKLKTHKKAGVTGALKNLVGINGNKEYLPHHRRHGAAAGGDCYPGRSAVKRALEYAYDRQNQAGSLARARWWRDVVRVLERARRLTGDRLGIEGSWSGNDTVWRTCLDLNRLLLYGRPDGTLAETVQRRVLHVVDAVVAGHGDGPLAPQPLPLGLLLAGESAAAVDRVGARLLGYDPERIPLVREAFGRFRWPIAGCAPGRVRLLGSLGAGAADEVLERHEPPCPVRHPLGWQDAALHDTRLAGTEGR